MRQDAAFFENREPVQHNGGIIFRTERTATFFYVAEESAEAARGILRENGCKTLAQWQGRRGGAAQNSPWKLARRFDTLFEPSLYS